MENALELLFEDINIAGIKIKVLNRISNIVLSKETVKVKIFNKRDLTFIDANYKIKGGPTVNSAVIVAIDNDGQECHFSEVDLLLVQIIDYDNRKSNRISIKFSSVYSFLSKEMSLFELPDEPGNYRFKLLSINDVYADISQQTNEFEVSPKRNRIII